METIPEQIFLEKMKGNCCYNCRITGVPLYRGLDGELHCADHMSLLWYDPQKVKAPARQKLQPVEPDPLAGFEEKKQDCLKKLEGDL